MVVPLWSVYTTTPSPHLMSYCVSRSSGSQRRGIRLWFSTRWASHFSLHYVTKLMSKKGSLWLIFDRYLHSGNRRFLSRSVFHQSKISYIYKKDFFYHLQVLTFVHLMPLIVFDLDRGCCPYSSPNDTPCVPSSSWLIPPWGNVRSLYPPYGLERVFTII